MEPLVLPPESRAISVVVVNWNTRDLLRECLTSLYRELDDLDAEVLVVDNASTDGSAAMIRQEFPSALLLANSANVGFARANNQAFRHCTGTHVMLLNPDTVVEPGAVHAMLDRLQSRHAIGLIGPKITHPEGRLAILHAGEQPSILTVACHFTGLSRLFPRVPSLRGLNLFIGEHDDQPCRVGWLSGACVVSRREVLETVGGFSEQWFMYAEDMEWCQRITEAGWDVEHYPVASVTHHVGAASRTSSGTSTMWVTGLRSWYRQRSAAGPVRALLFDLIVAGGFVSRWLVFRVLSWLKPSSHATQARRADDFKTYASAALRKLNSA